MMKIRNMAVLAAAALGFAACDSTTDSIGGSISDIVDNVNVETATFDIASNSIVADSVLARNSVGYLGKVRDPETNAYVTGDFMNQFYCLENYQFPNDTDIVSKNADGRLQYGLIQADSCEIRLFYSRHYGDSTRTMKLTAYEMDHPMNEDRNYYSNFDPMANGYVRNGGIRQDKVYTLTDFNINESLRDSSIYTPYITVKLNNAYTGKDGKRYSNYGSYIMSKYYEDHNNFKNAYTFRNNVVPGFFFKYKSGLGSMAYIDASQLNVYYRYKDRVSYTDSVNGRAVTLYKDSIYHGVTVFWGTEEVLQATTFTNDKATMARLAADQNCTYLKTPAGIFTEMTIPVDNITQGHEKDNILSAKVTVNRINNSVSGEFTFDVPQHVLMIPRDSLYSFFENNEMYNNRTSYVSTWAYGSSNNPTGNGYTFNNISGLVAAMAAIKPESRSANWNKVVLVPVTLETTSTTANNSSSYYYYYGYSQSQSTTVTKLAHDMSLTSTRLVKGTATDSPIKMEVIYSRFK